VTPALRRVSCPRPSGVNTGPCRRQPASPATAEDLPHLPREPTSRASSIRKHPAAGTEPLRLSSRSRLGHSPRLGSAPWGNTERSEQGGFSIPHPPARSLCGSRSIPLFDPGGLCPIGPNQKLMPAAPVDSCPRQGPRAEPAPEVLPDGPSREELRGAIGPGRAHCWRPLRTQGKVRRGRVAGRAARSRDPTPPHLSARVAPSRPAFQVASVETQRGERHTGARRGSSESGLGQRERARPVVHSRQRKDPSRPRDAGGLPARPPMSLHREDARRLPGLRSGPCDPACVRRRGRSEQHAVADQGGEPGQGVRGMPPIRDPEARDLKGWGCVAAHIAGRGRNVRAVLARATPVRGPRAIGVMRPRGGARRSEAAEQHQGSKDGAHTGSLPSWRTGGGSLEQAARRPGSPRAGRSHRGAAQAKARPAPRLARGVLEGPTRRVRDGARAREGETAGRAAQASQAKEPRE